MKLKNLLDRPGIPVVVSVTNVFDAIRAESGTPDECGVRSVLFHRAVIDLRVLSLELPPQCVDALGLSPDPQGTNRLSPVRVMINGQQATIPPCRGEGEWLVIGHITLTALGLKLDENGDLIDDPYPARWWPLDGI